MNATTLMPQPNIDACITGFHALSDPLRTSVVDHLRGQEMSVCDLCNHLSVSQSKLSFHLRVLKEAGLVSTRPQGRWTYYRLNLASFKALEQFLADFRRFSPIVPNRLPGKTSC